LPPLVVHCVPFLNSDPTQSLARLRLKRASA
jgi:hypothetical protein